MTSLQIALIVAGIVVIAGVLVYNWWQERRIRQRMDAAFRPRSAADDVLFGRSAGRQAPGEPRIEPSLGAPGAAAEAPAPTAAAPASATGELAGAGPDELPVEVIRRAGVAPAAAAADAGAAPRPSPRRPPVPQFRTPRSRASSRCSR
jgi:hypothetical protein